MKDYMIKINILKKYNSLNKEQTPYDDLLYINLNNTNEIGNILQTLNDYNKIYNKILLSCNIIIIKEVNRNIIIYYKNLYTYSNINCEDIIHFDILNNVTKVIYTYYINLYYIFKFLRFEKHVIFGSEIFKNNIYNYFTKRIPNLDNEKLYISFNIINYVLNSLCFTKKGIGTNKFNCFIKNIPSDVKITLVFFKFN
jgi:hypothetical protein